MSSDVKMTPKDFFLYFGMMAALYVSVVSFITLLFQYIDHLFPSALETYVDPYSGAIRFALATLVVIFPVYLWLTRWVHEEERKAPGKRDLAIRRWLIHITLFIAGITLIIDLVTLINAFLGGELTTRFIAKVAAVFIVTGGAFFYYLADLRGRWIENEALSKRIGIFVALAVLASIIGGFFIVGSPTTQRELRLDQDRVNDLGNMQWQIVNYWQAKENLPAELSDLEDEINGFDVPVDPKTGEAYGYRILEERTFELCATFAQQSPASPRGAALSVPARGLSNDWKHGEGETCFTRTIDPDFFPPFEK